MPLALFVGLVLFVLLVGFVILFLILLSLWLLPGLRLLLQLLVTLSRELLILMIAEQAFQATYTSTVPSKTSASVAAAAARVP